MKGSFVVHFLRFNPSYIIANFSFFEKSMLMCSFICSYSEFMYFAQACFEGNPFKTVPGPFKLFWQCMRSKPGYGLNYNKTLYQYTLGGMLFAPIVSYVYCNSSCHNI